MFSIFSLAETLGKTVNELLTGKKRPLSVSELTQWQAYWTVKRKLEEEQEKKSSSKGSTTGTGQDSQKTMGQPK